MSISIYRISNIPVFLPAPALKHASIIQYLFIFFRALDPKVFIGKYFVGGIGMLVILNYTTLRFQKVFKDWP
jgi:hypothetical protein